ncbi:hypothetical protein FH972_012243 [Carpinus fangiana]|uniref:2-C-methyl-D-erythritol 2,4-cyclodiphosphate synthase n=1 Tax=Carpinus fangiana TaxID=176857 RepID=A0A5N6R4N9_9ROSI|nr:hypothetical protein FH972_012243 [Carpinus fangiana]
MAMPAPPLSASPIPRKPLFLPTHSHSFPLSRLSIRPTTTKVATVRPSVSAVATSEVGQAPLSAIPSKALPFRVGHGFDLHRLEPGYPLIIGGIDIPHDKGCEAHSDGDVLLHCVVDAILGALGLPDIGQIFPDNDPKWKGAPSSVFIKEAIRAKHFYRLHNVKLFGKSQHEYLWCCPPLTQIKLNVPITHAGSPMLHLQHGLLMLHLPKRAKVSCILCGFEGMDESSAVIDVGLLQNLNFHFADQKFSFRRCFWLEFQSGSASKFAISQYSAPATRSF